MSNFTRNRFERGAVALTAAIAVGLGATACSGEKPAPAASTSETAKPSPETPAAGGTESTAENPYPKLYDLKLNPPTLSPEQAASMSDDELSKALQITVADVDEANFGESYAKAVVDRHNTWMNLGLGSEACVKVDVNTFQPESYKEEVVNKYYDLANIATFGNRGAGWSHDLPNNIVGRVCQQRYAIATGLWPKDTKPTEFGATIIAGTARAIKNSDGSYTGEFALRETVRPAKGTDPKGAMPLESYESGQTYKYNVTKDPVDQDRLVLSSLENAPFVIPQ